MAKSVAIVVTGIALFAGSEKKSAMTPGMVNPTMLEANVITVFKKLI